MLACRFRSRTSGLWEYFRIYALCAAFACSSRVSSAITARSFPVKIKLADGHKKAHEIHAHAPLGSVAFAFSPFGAYGHPVMAMRCRFSHVSASCPSAGIQLPPAYIPPAVAGRNELTNKSLEHGGRCSYPHAYSITKPK